MKTSRIRIRVRARARVFSLACLSLMAVAAQAQQATADEYAKTGQAQGEHRKPPPEALAACKSLASGAACNFTSPKGAETGTCGAPEGKPLACRPAHAGGPQGQQNPEKPKN